MGRTNHWIGLRLVGRSVPRDMLGARVTVERPDGSAIVRRVRTDGSYGSANDPRVLAGLGGQAVRRVDVRVRWPDGRTDRWSGVPVDRYTTLAEASGDRVGQGTPAE
jgi:hypothetical protein